MQKSPLLTRRELLKVGSGLSVGSLLPFSGTCPTCIYRLWPPKCQKSSPWTTPPIVRAAHYCEKKAQQRGSLTPSALHLVDQSDAL